MRTIMKTSSCTTARFFGVFASLFIILVCAVSLVVGLYIPLFHKEFSFLDVFLTLIFFVAFVLTLWSFYCASTISPGKPPLWLREDIVNIFVHGVLQDILHHGTKVELQEGDSFNSDGRPGDAKGHREHLENEPSGNLGLPHNQTPIKGGEEHHGSEHTAMSMRASDPLQTMLFSDVTLVASDALEAMEHSRESFEQEVSFLLGGARHCRFCRIYKLDDTHHCSTCRTCVHRMDHHCPWIGQCVGRENHKAFILFLFYVVIASGVAVLHTFIALVTRRISLVQNGNATLFLFAFIVLFVFFLLLALFLGQSLGLLLRGESTLQSLRRGAQRPLPYPRGRWANLRRVFGAGPALPGGPLPLRPQWPPAEAREEMFWARQRAVVEQRLCCMAEERANDEKAAESDRDSRECAVLIQP